MKYGGKTSPWAYVRAHLNTLYDARTQRPGLSDYFTFGVLPVLAGCFMFWFGLKLDSNYSAAIISALSIFVGLLFNALVLLLDIGTKSGSSAIREKIAKQLAASITFSIFLSLVIIVVMLPAFIKVALPSVVSNVLSVLANSLLVGFGLTFLMVLKRLYIIVVKALEDAA